MYICLCKAVTETDIHQGVSRGEVVCMMSLRERLGASTGCGCCETAARECLDRALSCKTPARAGEKRRGDEHAPGLHPDAELSEAAPA